MSDIDKKIALGQSLNLSQKEFIHLNPDSIDLNVIKETAKEYYKLILELNEEVLNDKEQQKITEKKILKIEL